MVRDLVAGSGPPFEDAGKHELKGVLDYWQHLYRVEDRKLEHGESARAPRSRAGTEATPEPTHIPDRAIRKS
jgi:hypothetical protein